MVEPALYPTAAHAQSEAKQSVLSVRLSVVKKILKSVLSAEYTTLKNVFTSLPGGRFRPHGSFSGVLAVPKISKVRSAHHNCKLRAIQMECTDDLLNYGGHAIYDRTRGGVRIQL